MYKNKVLPKQHRPIGWGGADLRFYSLQH